MNTDPFSSRPGSFSRFHRRPLIVVVLFFGLLGTFGLLGAYWFAHNGGGANGTELPYDQFSQKLNAGKIYEDGKHPLDLLIEEGSSTQTLAGFYSDLIPAKEHLDRLQPFHTTISLDYDKDLEARLKSAGLTPNIRNRTNVPTATLPGFLPILIFVLMSCLLIGVIYLVFSRVVRRSRPTSPQ